MAQLIHRSPLPPVEVPNRTVTDHVLGRARFPGEHTALVDGVTGERLTYRELSAAVLSAAGGLMRAGIQTGDVVALMSHNQPRYAVALHAAMAAGATVTTVNPALTPNEVRGQLTTTGAKVLIVSEATAGNALADRTAAIEQVFVLGRHEELRPFDDLLTGSASRDLPDIDPHTAIAALLMSSGTTGTAKAVMLTHRNLVANLEQTRVGWRLTTDDVQAAVLPFFHGYGLTIVLNSGLLAGATVVTLPGFTVDTYLSALARYRVTRAYLVPPMVRALAAAPQAASYDLSSLRYVLCGAAPVDEAAIAGAEARLGCRIRQGYGLTEAAPGTHQVFDDDFSSAPPASIGRLSPGTEARLVRAGTDIDVEPDVPGELLIRGPQVMAGYLNDPDATATAITDGWLHTGDLVRVDADGLFWVADRIKELIKCKGYQVAPAELEALLCTHEDVVDAAVVGIPDPRLGEAPKAFVVTAGNVDANELMAWVAVRVAPYKRVRSVEFVEQIPKSPTGKIMRRMLRVEA